MQRFYPAKAKAIIEEVLTQKLGKIQYDPTRSAEMSEELSRVIRTRIRSCNYHYDEEMKIPRYKLGVQVIFGESKGQGLRVASKCLWDVNFDNWASFTYTNDKTHCTCIVFGVYFE
jgi:hypothetical protein